MLQSYHERSQSLPSCCICWFYWAQPDDVVANKFAQETFGPFVYLPSLCIIIVVIASKDWQFLQMDMKNVFLNKKLTKKKKGLDDASSGLASFFYKVYTSSYPIKIEHGLQNSASL